MITKHLLSEWLYRKNLTDRVSATPLTNYVSISRSSLSWGLSLFIYSDRVGLDIIWEFCQLWHAAVFQGLPKQPLIELHLPGMLGMYSNDHMPRTIPQESQAANCLVFCSPISCTCSSSLEAVSCRSLKQSAVHLDDVINVWEQDIQISLRQLKDKDSMEGRSGVP